MNKKFDLQKKQKILKMILKRALFIHLNYFNLVSTEFRHKLGVLIDFDVIHQKNHFCRFTDLLSVASLKIIILQVAGTILGSSA